MHYIPPTLYGWTSGHEFVTLRARCFQSLTASPKSSSSSLLSGSMRSAGFSPQSFSSSGSAPSESRVVDGVQADSSGSDETSNPLQLTVSYVVLEDDVIGEVDAADWLQIGRALAADWFTTALALLQLIVPVVILTIRVLVLSFIHIIYILESRGTLFNTN
ncbi:hypothetical protein INR49_031143 [Caranx melampygus]|nr:hypothetical protein INR49_031143 [Caranx melampygus]